VSQEQVGSTNRQGSGKRRVKGGNASRWRLGRVIGPRISEVSVESANNRHSPRGCTTHLRRVSSSTLLERGLRFRQQLASLAIWGHRRRCRRESSETSTILMIVVREAAWTCAKRSSLPVLRLVRSAGNTARRKYTLGLDGRTLAINTQIPAPSTFHLCVSIVPEY